MLKTYQGGCHCGAVRYQADIDLTQGTTKCNCSICKDAVLGCRGQAGRIPPADRRSAARRLPVRLPARAPAVLQELRVALLQSGQLPEIGGAFVSINIACLDGVSDEELASLPIRYCNGRDYDWRHEPKVTSYL